MDSIIFRTVSFWVSAFANPKAELVSSNVPYASGRRLALDTLSPESKLVCPPSPFLENLNTSTCFSFDLSHYGGPMEGGKLIKRLKSHEAAKKFTKQDGGENDQRPEAPCLQPTSAALRAG
jgi:hypothetical protein